MHSRANQGLRVALLALLAFALVAGSASASVVIPPADDDLIVHADAVIIGRVTDIESHDDRQGKLSTYITIAIQEVLKGSLAQSSLTIRELGGEVGGVVAWASANPEFSVGERVLLFLDQRADGSLRVLHFYLGKFSIITDPATGDLVAVRPLPEEVTIIAPPGAAAAGIALGAVGRGLDEFKDHIRRRAGEARPLTARPSVALPLASATIPPDGTTERHQEFRFLRDPNPPGATDPNLVQPRFSQPDTNVPIVMHFNGTSEPLAPPGSNGGRNQVRDAFRAWSAVPTTSYRYVEGSDTTAAGFTADGINAISFRDPHGEISPPSNCGGVLAIGGMRFFATASMTVNGRQFSQAVEADLVFADGWDSCMVFYQNYANFAEVATHELGVKSQQIVPSDDSADGRLAVKRRVRPMPIVVVQPASQRGGAVRRGGVGDHVRPLAQQGLDEALGLAIGTRGVGSRKAVVEGQRLAGGGDQARAIGRAVVAEHALGHDAAPGEPRDGATQKAGDCDALLIAQDFGVGQAGAVIDADVHELPADAPHALTAIPRDAVADATNAPQLLDVDVDQLPRALPLVAPAYRRGFQARQARKAELAQRAGHRCAAQPDGLGDERPGPPTVAQPLNLHHQPCRDRARRALGPAGAILERQGALGRPRHPLVYGPVTHADGARDGGGPLPGRDALGNQSSTVGRGPGILVHVHPGHLPRVVGRLATTTIAEKGSRMDILLRLHT
jgi:hypothetical protein